MSSEYEKEAQRVCGSSVADGVIDMMNVTDPAVAAACLDYERRNMHRVTMLKVIRRRIAQLKKN